MTTRRFPKVTHEVLGLFVLVGGLAACESSNAPEPFGPGTTAGGSDNTYHHEQGAPDLTTGTDIPLGTANAQVAPPVEAARKHGCSKLTVVGLGMALASRGVQLAAENAPKDSAQGIYRAGAAALGKANYAGRVRETAFASTAATSKEFDIFVAAARELRTSLPSSTACPDVKLTDEAGLFTEDGISCLIGKLARAEHVTLANRAIADAVRAGASREQGIEIAIFALLSAAHTCE